MRRRLRRSGPRRGRPLAKTIAVAIATQATPSHRIGDSSEPVRPGTRPIRPSNSAGASGHPAHRSRNPPDPASHLVTSIGAEREPVQLRRLIVPERLVRQEEGIGRDPDSDAGHADDDRSHDTLPVVARSAAMLRVRQVTRPAPWSRKSGSLSPGERYDPGESRRVRIRIQPDLDRATSATPASLRIIVR